MPRRKKPDLTAEMRAKLFKGTSVEHPRRLHKQCEIDRAAHDLAMDDIEKETRKTRNDDHQRRLAAHRAEAARVEAKRREEEIRHGQWLLHPPSDRRTQNDGGTTPPVSPDRPPVSPDTQPVSPDTQDWSEIIRARIIADGWPAYALGREAGVHPSIVQRFLAGQRGLTLETACRLGAVLGLCLTLILIDEPATHEE